MSRRYKFIVRLSIWLGLVWLLWDVPGVRFGLIDNGVLGLGILTGLDYDDEISKLFRVKNSKGWFGAAIGGGLANLASDFLGGSFDPSIDWLQNFGISLGCILGLGWIPLRTLWEDK